MTRALVITNPAAARTDARAVAAIRDTLLAGGWSVEVQATAKRGDARRFAREGLERGVDVLVSYGGDGTAMQVAAGVGGTDVPPGVVPGGTGDLLAGNPRRPAPPGPGGRGILGAPPTGLRLGAV